MQHLTKYSLHRNVPKLPSLFCFDFQAISDSSDPKCLSLILLDVDLPEKKEYADCSSF